MPTQFLNGAPTPAATPAVPGSMSAADKAKLDGIAAGATVGYKRFVGEATANLSVFKAGIAAGWTTAWGNAVGTPMQFSFVVGATTERYELNAAIRLNPTGAVGTIMLLGIGIDGGAVVLGGGNPSGPSGSDNQYNGVYSFTGLAPGSHTLALYFYSDVARDVYLITYRYLQLYRVL